jgi:pyruvate/2-oxoglutarate dehydrogenase complex dihydrolipoamide dehydrogenase (E3) component
MSTIEKFEYVFLGGGKGGKSLAMELAKAGKRVAVVEQGMIGGSCINIACIPSKALIHSARVAHTVRSERVHERRHDAPKIDMTLVQRHVRDVVNGMVELNQKAFDASGFDLILGTGRFIAPRRIQVQTNDAQIRIVEGDHAFINTGTFAAIPDIPGLREADPMTHVDALRLDVLPEQLIVIGGGYIGLEMAQAFRRLGSEVTVIQEAARLVMREDVDVSEAIEAAFAEEGIVVRTAVKPLRVTGHSGESVSVELSDGSHVKATHLLVATGRVPRTQDIGLEEAGVSVDARGFIKVDERLATSAPNTWAIGEVAGTPMFTHASFDDYRVLSSQLAGGTRTTKDRVIPHALFIEPELGRVGINESEAKQLGIEVRVAKLPMSAVPRARTNGDVHGFMKAIVEAKTDRILGFTMLGTNAGEVITAVQMAMIGNLSYTAVRDSIIAHPVIAEGLNILFAKVPERV